MAGASHDHPPKLEVRYGRTEPRPFLKRFWPLLLIAAVIVPILIWAGFKITNKPTTWADKSHSIVSDSSATGSFLVTKPRNQPVTCRVHALNGRYAVVGYVDVEVPAEAPKASEHSVTIDTSERAVTVTVQKCRLSNEE